MRLNKRQEEILNIIKKSAPISIGDLLTELKEEASRITVARDLDKLLEQKLILRSGAGRSVVYALSPVFRLLAPINIEDYFSKELEQRDVQKNFDFSVFSGLDKIESLFDTGELNELEESNQIYQRKLKNISEGLLKKEFERLTIELSWKSSKIEGNTYTLLDTEALIRENKEALGHKKEESIMILNHKKALDYIRENKADFKKLSIKKVENTHQLLTQELKIAKGIRKRLVGILGTEYRPLDNEFQIREALERLIEFINNKKVDCFTKAVLAITLISYIQPFEDGNKRTARLMGNAVLMANDCCPLSYRSVDESEYKKSMIIFYEQNSVQAFKKIFKEQFKFACDNYF